MVYFIVSKQILYVLHTQLASLPEARKRAYGIGSVSYSIAGTSLSFRFWLRGKRANDDPEDANTVTLVLTENNELTGIEGRCNGRSFPVDLRHYRVFGILHEVGVLASFHAVSAVASPGAAAGAGDISAEPGLWHSLLGTRAHRGGKGQRARPALRTHVGGAALSHRPLFGEATAAVERRPAGHVVRRVAHVAVHVLRVASASGGGARPPI